jgi:hypothetical protein
LKPGTWNQKLELGGIYINFTVEFRDAGQLLGKKKAIFAIFFAFTFSCLP